MATLADGRTYEFNGYRLSAESRSLSGTDGSAIPLKPKVFDTLLYLVEHRGKLLSKSQLIEEIWHGTIVEENSLNQNISTLRRVFREKPGENRFIVTVPGRGYQFVAHVDAGSPDEHGRRSLAVLPLDNLSEDSSQAYFVDGMTEELIARLARISGLRVASRTSAMVFRDSEKTLPMIAAALGVDYIIEGSVLRAGDRIRITVQLIDASDAHVWADSFEREFSDVLILQSEVAQTVASKIAVQLSDSEQAILDSAESVDPQVYNACLKGLEHYYRLLPGDLDQALKYFQHVLTLDPGYARACAGIAAVWIGRQQMGFVPSRTATPIAKEAALRAVELDPLLPEAHFVLSEVKGFGEFDFDSAEQHILRALTLNPSYAEAHAIYSHELICMARHDEALQQIRLALELDPFNPFFKALYGVVLYFHQRFEEATDQFRLALEVIPGLPFALQIMSNCQHYIGQFEGALETQRTLMSTIGNPEALHAIDAGYTAGGYTEAMRRLADLTAKQSSESDNGAVWVAHRYSQAGEHDLMFEWFAKAIDQRDPDAPYIRGVFPELLPFIEDERYRQLVERLNAARQGMMFAQ